MAMATGCVKVVVDSDEASSIPESSPRSGKGGEKVLEVEKPIEFVDPLPKDFECSLCLQYLKQPTLTSCGHHFCKECIDRVVERLTKLKQVPVCPLCKDQNFQMLIDKSTERKISSLRVYCFKKSQGCGWEGELGSLNHHMDLKEGNCAFVEVECEFSEMGCTTRVMRRDLLKHMEENTHKHIILMSVLGSKMSGGSLESSRKLQERRAEMLQMQLHHRDEEFQRKLEVVEKQLAMKSEELADVERKLKVKNDEVQSLQLQLQMSERDLNERITELEQQLKDKDRQTGKLEKELGAQIISIKEGLDARCPLPFDFVMSNFSQLKASSTEWYSPPFYTHPGGYRLSLRVDANGYGKLKGTHVSRTFYTEPGEFDEVLTWPRRSPRIYIQLLNHCTGRWDMEICCGSGTFRKPGPAHKSIGCCCYAMPHSYLEYDAKQNTQWLKDDCLQFRIARIEFNNMLDNVFM